MSVGTSSLTGKVRNSTVCPAFVDHSPTAPAPKIEAVATKQTRITIPLFGTGGFGRLTE